ncbi:MAG: gamma-glutamyltransferase family protein [Pseudomonadota bacterium]
MRNFHDPGRSAAYASTAMCATSHPMASLTAVETLKAGGNAMDAALAASAVLTVVEPHMTGIGGDCFAMIAAPDGSLHALNASGRAPEAATLEALRAKGVTSLEMGSAHAVTVPGAIDGWVRLNADWGRKPLAELLTPAIMMAREGTPVAPRVARDWAAQVDKLSGDEGARAHLLVDGAAPRVGDVMRYEGLARALEAIAQKGRAGFYEGAVAADIIATLQAGGGLHTHDDLASQASTYVAPIAVDYGGLRLHELPPNNHGIVALMILRLIETLKAKVTLPDDPKAAARYHLMIEAARLAYAARDAFVADPDQADVPVGHLLSDHLIDTLAARIDPAARTADLGPIPEPAGTDTIYLSVVDGDGMAVSFINSVFSAFGSGIVTREFGFALHNRGQGFSMDAGHPNVIAPRKRPMHTLVPAIATKDGQPVLSFGVMGAAFQPIGHAYVMTNMLDYGMDPQEALDHPRVFFDGDQVGCERTVPRATIDGLQAMGHDAVYVDDPWGGGQIVQIDRARGTLIGASDPRKDGIALGY